MVAIESALPSRKLSDYEAKYLVFYAFAIES
jgi:hypothetical protein